jgi:hypothetical protein
LNNGTASPEVQACLLRTPVFPCRLQIGGFCGWGGEISWCGELYRVCFCGERGGAV